MVMIPSREAFRVRLRSPNIPAAHCGNHPVCAPSPYPGAGSWKTMDAKLKHLKFIQDVINRLATNSFRLKG